MMAIGKNAFGASASGASGRTDNLRLISASNRVTVKVWVRTH